MKFRKGVHERLMLVEFDELILQARELLGKMEDATRGRRSQRVHEKRSSEVEIERTRTRG